MQMPRPRGPRLPRRPLRPYPRCPRLPLLPRPLRPLRPCLPLASAVEAPNVIASPDVARVPNRYMPTKAIVASMRVANRGVFLLTVASISCFLHAWSASASAMVVTSDQCVCSNRKSNVWTPEKTYDRCAMHNDIAQFGGAIATLHQERLEVKARAPCVSSRGRRAAPWIRLSTAPGRAPAQRCGRREPAPGRDGGRR